MRVTYLRYIAEPRQHLVDALEIAWRHGVGDAIVVHDLDPTELVVTGVHLPP